MNIFHIILRRNSYFYVSEHFASFSPFIICVLFADMSTKNMVFFAMPSLRGHCYYCVREPQIRFKDIFSVSTLNRGNQEVKINYKNAPPPSLQI